MHSESRATRDSGNGRLAALSRHSLVPGRWQSILHAPSCSSVTGVIRGSLTRAAFLSARNDTLANVAIIVAGFLTAYTLSVWPDLIVGLGITLMNAHAAREVWTAARTEHAGAKA